MYTATRDLQLRLEGVRTVDEAQPTGVLEFRLTHRYLALRWTLNGVVVLDDHTTTPETMFFLHVPTYALPFPALHLSYLSDAVSDAVSLLGPSAHALVFSKVASKALQLVDDPRGFMGYSMVVEFRVLQVEEFEEGSLLDSESAPTEAGSTRTTIERGGFAADKSDQELGTCSICLEEFSSLDGTQLLRTDCSHVYHRTCLLPWLKKQNSCPNCRREVYKNSVHNFHQLL